MAKWTLAAAAATAALWAACGTDAPSGADTTDAAINTDTVEVDTVTAADTTVANVAPTAPEVAIDPVLPLTDDDLVAHLVTPASDADGPEALSYHYVWTLDDVEQADVGAHVSAARTAKGQRWSVRVHASDGTADGPAATATTTIGDTPATLAGAALDATEVSTLETLTCTALGFADPDGDPEAVSVRWLLAAGDARTLLAEGQPTYAPAALAVGDQVVCELTPLSAGTSGAPVESAAATLVAPTAPVVALSAPDGAGGEAHCDITTPATHVGDAATTTFYWAVNGAAEAPGQATRSGLTDCDLLTCRAEVAAGPVTLSSAVATLALPLGPACAAPDVCHVASCALAGGCDSVALSATSCPTLDPCLGPGICTDGVCAPAGPAAGDGSACDDGDPCTTATTCAAGACTGGAAAPDGTSCDDADPCTLDDACASAVCVGGDPAADGMGCDDGDGCTTADRCAGGACQPGALVDCASAGGACAVGSCQSTGPEDHVCVAANRPAGSSCSDSDICATAAYCDGEGVCLEGPPVGVGDARLLQIDIGAHPLDTVQDAIWDVVVARATGGEPLLSTRVSSAQCGAGGSAASVAAACDAAGEGEVVTARLKGIYTAPVPAPGRFGDPVPGGGIAFADPGDLVRTVECLDLPATTVEYDISLARPSEGGFFTKAINFDQIYCAANFTCCDDSDDNGVCDADIDLLFGTDGQRHTTFKLGFACAAETGAGMDLALYMDDLVLSCGGTDTVVIHPASGDGNLCSAGQVGSCEPKVSVTGGGAANVFQAAVYKGVSSFGGIDRSYWNVAFGVDKAVVAAGDCQLTTRATADTDAVAGGAQGGVIVAPDVYPYLVWDVNISDGAGVVCVEHAPGDTPAYVYATYSDGVNSETFQWGYNP